MPRAADAITPEQLLRALLLQALYTIRSERLLMEEIDYKAQDTLAASADINLSASGCFLKRPAASIDYD